MTHYPDSDWTVVAPEEADMDPGKLAAARQWLEDRAGDNPYRVVIVRNGYLVAEWNHHLAPDAQLKLASATKSIYASILGITIFEGKLPSADARVIDYYPEFMDVPEDAGPKPGRYAFPKDKDITFRQLISNTSGYMKPGEEPGKVFHYQTYGMNVLAHAIAKIYEYYDINDPEGSPGLRPLVESMLGQPIGASWGFYHFNFDLQPSARLNIFGYYDGVLSNALDMARLGWLWRNLGRWQDRQLIPADWLREATRTAPAIRKNCPQEQWKYGYGFWCNDFRLLWPRLPADSLRCHGRRQPAHLGLPQPRPRRGAEPRPLPRPDRERYRPAAPGCQRLPLGQASRSFTTQPEESMESTMSFHDKNVLVTGGASGIGAAVALRFAQAGAHVVIADVDADRARQVIDTIEKGGGHAEFRYVNLADEDSIAACGHELCARLTGLRVLVNNAGIVRRKSIAETDHEDWDAQIAINLRAPALMAKALLPLMQQQGAAIVNISSEGGYRPRADHWVYDATKAGIGALTRAMAVEFAPLGHPCQRRRAGLDCDRDALRPCAGSSGPQSRVGVACPSELYPTSLGPARGDRGRRVLPGERRCVLHHRHNAACGRRAGHPLRRPALLQVCATPVRRNPCERHSIWRDYTAVCLLG